MPLVTLTTFQVATAVSGCLWLAAAVVPGTKREIFIIAESSIGQHGSSATFSWIGCTLNFRKFLSL